MDRKAVAFARSWATRYVRTKHPHGLDVEDVENRILESLYKYSRGKMNGRDSARPSQDGEATASQCMMKALSEALNEIQNESRRNLRALPVAGTQRRVLWGQRRLLQGVARRKVRRRFRPRECCRR